MLGSETLVYAGNARQKVGEVTSYFHTQAYPSWIGKITRIVGALGGPAATTRPLSDLGRNRPTPALPHSL